MKKAEYKILINNDEPITAYSIFLELANIGFTKVYFAKTYEEALFIANSERPFLVIQDIVFSSWNANEQIREDDFCYYLKKKYRINHIYISGYRKKLIKKTNPTAFLSLPPKKAKLLEAVERGFSEYTGSTSRRSFLKYKVSITGLRSIRKMKTEIRTNKSNMKIAERLINGKIIHAIDYV